jgi:predicted RecA/RadA family phage recombinase
LVARFVQDDCSVDFTPDADTPVGSVVVLGSLVGVSMALVLAGQLGALTIEGVFDFPKAVGGGTALPNGSQLYWDATNQQATLNANSGANKPLGKSIKAATDDDETVRVLLLQLFGVVSD